MKSHDVFVAINVAKWLTHTLTHTDSYTYTQPHTLTHKPVSNVRVRQEMNIYVGSFLLI